jgi:hypothetical protein
MLWSSVESIYLIRIREFDAEMRLGNARDANKSPGTDLVRIREANVGLHWSATKGMTAWSHCILSVRIVNSKGESRREGGKH